MGGFIGIGIAFGALKFVDGEEEEGGAFHGWCSLEVLGHRDCGFRVLGCWLGMGTMEEIPKRQRNISRALGKVLNPFI